MAYTKVLELDNRILCLVMGNNNNLHFFKIDNFFVIFLCYYTKKNFLAQKIVNHLKKISTCFKKPKFACSKSNFF